MTRKQAIEAFQEDICEEDGITAERFEHDQANGEGVFVNHVVFSNTPIVEVEPAQTQKAGKSVAEHAQLAEQFFDELLEQTETIRGIEETYGVATLVDLMYLQSTILKGGFIDQIESSRVMDVINLLPSARVWSTYVR